jgi:hypothetical protein
MHVGLYFKMSVSMQIIFKFFSFILLIRWITLLDFQMLNQFYIPGKPPLCHNVLSFLEFARLDFTLFCLVVLWLYS